MALLEHLIAAGPGLDTGAQYLASGQIPRCRIMGRLGDQNRKRKSAYSGCACRQGALQAWRKSGSFRFSGVALQEQRASNESRGCGIRYNGQQET